MKISREQVRKRILREKFTYKGQTDRVELYRQAGTKQRITLPWRDFYEEKLVRVVLGQAGLSAEQIDEFLRTAIKSE